MRWAGLTGFPAGTLILAAVGYAGGEPVLGTAAILCAIAWAAVIPRRTEGAGLLLGISGGIGVLLLFSGVGFYPILAGEVITLVGFEAGMSRRELSPFPAEHRRAFARRRLPLLGLAGIGGGGLAALIVNLHLTLSFLPALGISIGVLAGLGALLSRVK